MYELINESVFDRRCDLVIIPFSTDGTISSSFMNDLEKFRVSPILEDIPYKLGDLIIIQSFENYSRRPDLKYVAFACTVDRNQSNYAAIRKIGRELGSKIQNLDGVRTINTPILGTGAGRLDYFFSLNIFGKAFYETAPDASFLNFCTINSHAYETLKNQENDLNTPSSRQALLATMQEIEKYEIVTRIKYEKSFYYQLAKEKFEEFQNFTSSDPLFYSNLSNNFRFSKLTFSEFLASFDNSSREFKFLTLCGELIAYIDHKAYFKNLWNKYDDKRVLAHSSVRQNYWLANLLKYKDGDLRSIGAKSIKNALLYLLDPERNVAMLSEAHRKNVFREIILQPYENEQSIGELFKLFESLHIYCTNPLNNGVLYTIILYLPEIKALWDKDKNDSTDLLSNSKNKSYLASELIWENLRMKSKVLDLGNCGLTDFFHIPQLFQCSHLEELVLSNEWAEFENGKWKKRTSNNSGPINILNELPKEISKLKNLRRLVCGGNWRDGDHWDRWGIKTIHPLLKLGKLEYLNLSNNHLQGLTGLGDLKSLKIIHANNNYISTVPPLTNLKKLEEIYLSNNLIKSVDFLSKVKAKIHTIDLHANQINDLSELQELISILNISNTKWELETINVAKNPLEQPPMEFIEQGQKAVLSYFKDTSSGKYINKEIKIILVGNSGVGKSTLAKYLDDEKDLHISHLPTHWMVEKEIASKNIIDKITDKCLIRLFDFGGHDYFHDTHHLFFSKNTIYILLWDEDTNHLDLRILPEKNTNDENYVDQTQDYPIKYWLESVKYFIKDTVEASNIDFEIIVEETYNGSLCVIQNKVDSVSKIGHLNSCDIVKKYPFVYEFLNLDILSKRNMGHFDDTITEILNSTEIIGQVLPDFYKPIKEDIKQYSGQPILTFEEFRNYCNSLIDIVIDFDQTFYLVDYLKKVGMVMYIGESRPNKIYIDKNWVIKNIYEALKDVREKKGIFDLQHVKQKTALNDQQVLSLIDVMLGFKMIVKHPYQQKYIAPLYLPLIPDHKINLFLNQEKIPYRRLEYSGFIHKSIILDFFHEYGNRIVKDSLDTDSSTYYYWKDALIIRDAGSDSIVMIKFILGTDEGNSHVDLFSLRDNSDHRFIIQVLNSLKEISKKYDFEEMVTIDGNDFVSLEILTTNAKLSKLVFTEKRKADLIDVQEKNEKLFQLKDFENFLPDGIGIRKKKVVISYSKKDLVLVHNFVRYLRPLMAQNLIDEPWYCTLQNPALEWDKTIQGKFKEADIVFFMVSEYFYSTEYIIEKEIKTTIARYNNDKNVKIVPIILEHYDWSRPGEWDLGRFSALPYQAKPVSDFGNPKIAWYAIAASIKMMIEKDLDPSKSDLISREIQEIYERQVHGKLDRNF